ncbi:hypothetical protein [Longitalea luteola]|uniref:hypothetical protein n=1 Tax=Longitalea luteola TaxID=2812563 RepID=UPI001A95CA83|nr:hypothetical protein [Longitalea luteola]
MLFNSLAFLVFLHIVFCLYWFVCNKRLRLQNGLVLVASDKGATIATPIIKNAL